MGHPDRLLLDGGAGLRGLALHQLEHGGLGPLLGGRSVEAGLEGGGGELLPVVGPGVRLGEGGGALVNAETPPLGHGRGWGGLGGGECVGLTNEGSRGSKKPLD